MPRGPDPAGCPRRREGPGPRSGPPAPSRPLARLLVHRLRDELAGHGALYHADVRSGAHLERDLVVVHALDGAEHTADGDDLVADLEAVHKLPLLADPSLLGADQKEIEDGHHQGQRDEEGVIPSALLGEKGKEGCGHRASPMENGGSAAAGRTPILWRPASADNGPSADRLSLYRPTSFIVIYSN